MPDSEQSMKNSEFEPIGEIFGKQVRVGKSPSKHTCACPECHLVDSIPARDSEFRERLAPDPPL